MDGELNGAMEEAMDTSSPPSSPMEKKAMLYPNHCKSTNIHNNINHNDQKLDLHNIRRDTDSNNSLSPNTSEVNHDNGKDYEVIEDEQYSNGSYNENSNNIELCPKTSAESVSDDLAEDEEVLNDGEVDNDIQMQDYDSKDKELSRGAALNKEDSLDIKLRAENSFKKSSLVITTVSEASRDSETEINDVDEYEEENSNTQDIETISKSDTQDDVNDISQDENDLSPIENDISDQVEIIKDDLKTGNNYQEVDSEEDSSDEGSVEQVIEDTVSVDSHDDESPSKSKSSDVVILDNGNNDNEVHEIISDNENDDDCIVEPETKEQTKPAQSVDLRRSSRTIKRKRYADEDDESDIEEVTMEDPLYQSSKSKPFILNNSKSLGQMVSKQMRSGQMSNDKKEPTVVIIDTNTILSGKVPLHGKNVSVHNSINSQQSAQELYQSIAARGTTVTPIPTKSLVNTSTNTSAPQPQPHILPSLTDDMFVVEAPSFIVPYVYEKPSLKPFREFVDTLGKELDEIRSKQEIDKPDKEKDTLKDDEEKSNEDEEMEGAPEVVAEKDKDKDGKTTATEVEEVEVTKKKKSRRDRKNDDDDASWDGESEDSDDEVASEDEEKTIVIKEKDDTLDDIKTTITDLSIEKVPGFKSDNYFDCSLGKFFINIGINLVQEYVQHDLLKLQNRKLYREKKTGVNTKGTETAISSLMKNLQFSKENNAPYSFPQHKCEFCSFKTESMLAMSYHLETPHMKNNVYKCNFCSFEIRSPHDILYHMEAEHNIRGRLERAPAYHQCANCPFEDNGKGKLARHLIPCAKKFKPELNLAPPTEWEPPAKIPKITRARNNLPNPYQGAFNRNALGVNNLVRSAPIVTNNMLSSGMNNFRPRNRPAMPVTPRAMPSHGTPMIRGGVMVRHNAPTSPANNYPIMNNQANKGSGTPKLLQHQPSISITPLPRQPQPSPGHPVQQTKGNFVICEICDGYIKDLEQLRNHMQWIHKVKIHPKMIYNRPPLNCQKCDYRFFTDQGLERHLLGTHGLVTSLMQESANRGKDAGRCPVCGRVYQWKLLNHVSRDHNKVLKPAHLSYKCTVCTATFAMYKQFENHVYSAHSVVAKRVIDKSKPQPPKPNASSILKPLKINDEITIIPQPAKPADMKGVCPLPSPSI